MSGEELAWHYRVFKRLGWSALIGLAAFMFIAVANSTYEDSSAIVRISNWQVALILLSGFAMIPFVIHATLVCVWHWKARYRGEQSRFWGALLVFEVTGWFKIVYLLRHFIPDARKTGRYA